MTQIMRGIYIRIQQEENVDAATIVGTPPIVAVGIVSYEASQLLSPFLLSTSLMSTDGTSTRTGTYSRNSSPNTASSGRVT